MARVSVIVPLYNKAPFIRRALDSIAAQTFRDFEAMVVDDGSSDGGGQLVAEYPDRRFRLLRQPNRGPGAARNRGIEEARGDLVAFLDGDDEWMPDYLEKAVSELETEGPRAAAFSCCYIEFPKGISTERMWRARGLCDGLVKVSPETAPELVMYMLAFMHSCTTVARTAAVRRWGGFFESDRCVYGEDSFLWLKVLLNDPVIFRIKSHVHIHREAASLSGNLTQARPLEPFLQRPEEIERVCPEHLRGLLAQLLTIRAFKTACVWGVWGRWREARELRGRFRLPGDYRLRYYWSSLVCSSPLGAAIGAFWRSVGPR